VNLDPSAIDPAKYSAVARAAAARGGAQVITAVMRELPAAAELPGAVQETLDALLVGALAHAVRALLDAWDDARIVGLATTNGAGAALVLTHVEAVRRTLMTFEEQFAPLAGAALPPYCPPLESEV
jgi:hypothetical protein